MGQTADGNAALTNPQAQNSYSYAGNNPIINKDPSGRYFELSVSAVGARRAFSAGVRFDLSGGLDVFGGGGTGIGIHGGAEGMWSPGPVSNQRGSAVTVNSTVANGVGGRVSQELVNYDANSRQGSTYPNTRLPSGGVVVGAGSSVSVQQEFTYPVLRSNPNSRASQIGNTMSRQANNLKGQLVTKLGQLVSLLQSQAKDKNQNKPNP